MLDFVGRTVFSILSLLKRPSSKALFIILSVSVSMFNINRKLSMLMSIIRIIKLHAQAMNYAGLIGLGKVRYEMLHRYADRLIGRNK